MSEVKRIKRKKKPRIVEFFTEMDPTKLVLGITSAVVIILAIIVAVVIIVNDNKPETKPTSCKAGTTEVSASAADGGTVPLTAVQGVEVESTTENSISLKWKKVPGAEGYNAYLKTPQAVMYTIAKSVSGENALKCTIGDLEQGENYSVYVTPFRGDDEYTSDYSIQNTYTLPEKPAVTALSTDSDGSIKIEWTPNEKAGGFRVDYKTAESDNFLTGNSQDLPGGIDCSATFRDVEQYREYDFKVCAYIISDGKKYETSSEIYTVTADPNGNTPDEIIDPNKPMVALTFDDGPAGNASEKILDVLENNNAKATFFMVGANAVGNPDNLRRKVELGMELGNHTWDHKNYGDDVDSEEITKACEGIKETAGRRPTCFRSPGGITTDKILAECKKQRMPAYYWTIDTEDWKSRDSKKIYDAVMNNVKDGDIILMHEIYDSTADAVAKIVPELKERGFQMVTCRQLVIAKTGKLPVPGTEYRFVNNIDNGKNKTAQE